MKSRLIIFLLIFGTLFFICPDFTYSKDIVLTGHKDDISALNKKIAERKEKIKQLESTIESYKKNITKKRTEAVSLTNQMSILNNKYAQTEADVELTEEKIDQAEMEIEALKLSILDKEVSIDKQVKIISKIVRNIHAEDQKNYLEIMLTSESFADFYNQIRYLESIYTDIGKSVKNLKIIKEDLGNKKTQTESRKTIYENLKIELTNKQEDLIDQSNVKENLLVRTQASEIKYRTLLKNLRQQYQEIEGEVKSYESAVRKKLVEMEGFKEVSVESSGKFYWPVVSHYITSRFHDPDYPFRHIFEHSGMDIRAAQGTPIKAASSGYVARAKRCSSSKCYSYTLLVHSNNISTLYGHMSSISVKEDQFVGKGDVIGYTGGTPGTIGAGPFVTGPHIHFEVRKNGIPVNPINYF